MKMQRRHQVRAPYAYCADETCDWTDATGRYPVIVEAQAAAHVEQTGHECRVVTSRETILRPAQLQAVTRA
jgi:hypothetical protein